MSAAFPTPCSPLEVPVRVEYELTEKAQKLQPILQQLIQWQVSEA